jgi:sec-independent protein translocase protein TatA
MLANLFGPESIGILLVALIVIFGANKLPKMAKNLGEASKEFKKAQAEAEAEAQAAAAKPATSDTVTLSKSELDALLAEREAKARREAADRPPATN